MLGDRWQAKTKAFWSLKSSWEVSSVWELKMHIMVGAGGSVGLTQPQRHRERWFFENGVRRADGTLSMTTFLFLLSVNRLHGSSLHLLHWLKTKGKTKLVPCKEDFNNLLCHTLRLAGFLLLHLPYLNVLLYILLLKFIVSQRFCTSFVLVPLPLSFFDLLLEGTCFFFKVWAWACSLHRRSWKLINFHIMKAWVRQMAARTVILVETQSNQVKLLLK